MADFGRMFAPATIAQHVRRCPFNNETQLGPERAAHTADDMPVKSRSCAEVSAGKTQCNAQVRCRQPRRKRRQQARQNTRNTTNLSSQTKAWMDDVIIPLLLQRLRKELAVKEAA